MKQAQENAGNERKTRETSAGQAENEPKEGVPARRGLPWIPSWSVTARAGDRTVLKKFRLNTLPQGKTLQLAGGIVMGNRDGKGRAILMCAGEYEPMEILRGAEDFVVAVDGGLARLLKAGIEPDLVLGDFDSLQEKYLPWLYSLKKNRPEKLIRLPCEKDDTDTLYAARVCLERGYKRIDLYGALGGRLDHTIANIQTLSWIRRQGGYGYLLGKNTLATVLCGEMIMLPDTFEGIFSIFALDGRVTGVTLEGMKYPLFEGEMTNTFPLGVSNEVSNKVSNEESNKVSNEVSNEAGAEKRASASVREGLALMILNRREGSKGIDPGELERREIR